MKILPEISKVKTLAAEGKYDIIPISTEILSDIRTPIETMKILKNVSTHCYMLESVAESERWGRYTFLGFDPKISVTVEDGKIRKILQGKNDEELTITRVKQFLELNDVGE